MDLLPYEKMVSILKSGEYCYYINEEGAMFSEFRPSYMDQITCWQRACGKIGQLYPEYVYKGRIALFQASLLTAGEAGIAYTAGKKRKGGLFGELHTSCKRGGPGQEGVEGAARRIQGQRNPVS